MITEKENYLMLLRGEQPEWIPTYTFGGPAVNGVYPCTHMMEPPLLCEFRVNNGGKDIWGVEFIPTYETGNALIPKPSDFVLEDITKWRDVIKAPSLEGIDWETMAKKQIEASGIDRTQTALAFNMHMGYFQQLMALMGFTEGLCAMFEEPEEVYALLDYICDFYCKVRDNIIAYYKPDVFTMMDDTAAWANPFISLDMYRRLILPFHERQSQWARDNGIPITMHNCGKCECFLDDLVGIGVNLWEPAQTCNDLVGIKKKFGNRLVIAGGWDSQDYLGPDVTDEEIYNSVIQTFDTLAPGGGYAFMGNFLGPVGDAEVKRKNAILYKAVADYSRTFYKK